MFIKKKITRRRWTADEVYKLIVHIKTQYVNDLDIIALFVPRGGFPFCESAEQIPDLWAIAEDLDRTEGAVEACWRRVVDWGMFPGKDDTPFEKVCKEAFERFWKFEKEYSAKRKLEEEEEKVANIKSRYHLDDHVYFSVEGMCTHLLVGKIVRVTHVVKYHDGHKKLYVSYDIKVLTKYDKYKKTKHYSIFENIAEDRTGFIHESELSRQYMIARKDGLGVIAFHNTNRYTLEIAMCMINQEKSIRNDKVLLEVFRDSESWDNPALAKPEEVEILSISDFIL